MAGDLKKFWLKYSCGCSEKILCNEMQSKSWRALVGSAKTFCKTHKVSAVLSGFQPRKEDSNASD